MKSHIIHQVNEDEALSSEPLGTKPKFWLQMHQDTYLFKSDVRGTGEDWAEVVVSEIAELLEIPHVKYEFAKSYNSKGVTKEGVICKNLVAQEVSLILGNEILLENDPDYPARERYKVSMHTVDVIKDRLIFVNPPVQDHLHAYDFKFTNALEVFISYLMLDALVSNQDRHHENWGVLRQPDGTLNLAPSFDHGASLARNIKDQERLERLNTADKNRTITEYVKKARSAIYLNKNANKPLTTHEVFKTFSRGISSIRSYWISKLERVSMLSLKEIVYAIPENRMTDISKQFTLRMIEENKKLLVEDNS